tara:strand:+ start:316 stop:531 length:216 start_codon:yes stop_codon:yes gene_type:complete
MLSNLTKENLALSLLLAIVCSSIMSYATDISPGLHKISIFLFFVFWLGILSKFGKSSWIKRLRKKTRHKKE